METEQSYIISARDGSAMIFLRRSTRDSAEKKAAELEDMGYFEVQIIERSANEAA
jgi:hypothetical protein